MKKGKIILIVTAGLFSILLLSFGAGAKEKTKEDRKDDMPKFFVPKPPPSENFPCSKCHSYRTVDKRKRKFELYHTNIVLKHAEDRQWCFNCHEGDKLKLANGELIDYDKSYILCGQCHGTIIRDWKAGIHGKMTGMWDGDKVYRLCVTCHDPHQPRFKPLEPKPVPMKPSDIK